MKQFFPDPKKIAMVDTMAMLISVEEWFRFKKIGYINLGLLYIVERFKGTTFRLVHTRFQWSATCFLQFFELSLRQAACWASSLDVHWS